MRSSTLDRCQVEAAAAESSEWAPCEMKKRAVTEVAARFFTETDCALIFGRGDTLMAFGESNSGLPIVRLYRVQS